MEWDVDLEVTIKGTVRLRPPRLTGPRLVVLSPVRIGNMSDARVNFTKDPDPNGILAFYRVDWTLNGTFTGSTVLTKNPDSENAGYESLYSSSSGAVALSPGMAVGCSVVSVDSLARESPPVVSVPPSVSVEGPPPPALLTGPGSVTLTLVP
jgi:hypothetical protein